MTDKNERIPNVMPDALVEPITDMELLVAKLKHDGELTKHHANIKPIPNRDKEV